MVWVINLIIHRNDDVFPFVEQMKPLEAINKVHQCNVLSHKHIHCT
jgi:hypothetical protein